MKSVLTTSLKLLRWGTIWPQQTWLKIGGSLSGAAGSPSNTMSPGPRPTSAPSDSLIHPTVWPQYTNISHRQTGQTDNGTAQ